MKFTISDAEECYICRTFLGLSTTEGLETHHFIHGRGLRELADADGLYAKVCFRHHRALHDDPSHPYDKELKAIAEKAFIIKKMSEGYSEGQARGIFFNRYGRHFDY